MAQDNQTPDVNTPNNCQKIVRTKHQQNIRKKIKKNKCPIEFDGNRPAFNAEVENIVNIVIKQTM